MLKRDFFLSRPCSDTTSSDTHIDEQQLSTSEYTFGQFMGSCKNVHTIPYIPICLFPYSI